MTYCKFQQACGLHFPQKPWSFLKPLRCFCKKRNAGSWVMMVNVKPENMFIPALGPSQPFFTNQGQAVCVTHCKVLPSQKQFYPWRTNYLLHPRVTSHWSAFQIPLPPDFITCGSMGTRQIFNVNKTSKKSLAWGFLGCTNAGVCVGGEVCGCVCV